MKVTIELTEEEFRTIFSCVYARTLSGSISEEESAKLEALLDNIVRQEGEQRRKAKA